MTQEKPRIPTTRKQAREWGHKYYFSLTFCQACEDAGSPYQRKRYASSGLCLTCCNRRNRNAMDSPLALEHKRAVDRERQARRRAKLKAAALAAGEPKPRRGRPPKGPTIFEQAIRDRLQDKSE